MPDYLQQVRIVRWTSSSAILLGLIILVGPSAAEEIRELRLPGGLEAQVWASSPMFFNPTNIDVDHRGRVWVAEAVNYRRYNNHRAEQLQHAAGDRVVILEDTDGDGRADRSSVFVQDPDLVAPMGIAVFDNQVLVSCSPSLLLYIDVDRNGRFEPAVDRKEKLLTGFGGLDHDHGLHALVSGPDGAWYLATGNAGPHEVTDRAGWTFRAGSGYTGGSPYNLTNKPGLKSDDGRMYVGGVALRFRPDGAGLSVIGHNFRNCYELCLDSLGNVFQGDNDDTNSCRTTWLMEYGNAGYSSADGSRSWEADRRPGQAVATAHWRQDDPGVMPAGDVYGAGSPTGIAFYENGSLGPDYSGRLLSCEAGRNVVWSYSPRPTGAGMALERTTFCTTVSEDDPGYHWESRGDDVRKWFRPSDICVGADGALYVADWFDPVVGGHEMDDRKGSGTIYRIVARGTNPRTPTLDLATPDGQLAALASPANNVRFLGFQGLLGRGETALKVLEPWFAGNDRFMTARAAFLAARLGPNGRRRVEQLLDHSDELRRLVAFRALRRAGADVVSLAQRLCRDPAASVRREVAFAMRDVSAEHSRDILLALAEGFDGTDRWYLESLGTACEGKESIVYEALIAGTTPDAWSDRIAAIAWRLHPTAATPALIQRAMSKKLSHAARQSAIDALAFLPEEAALRGMERIALDGPDDLRDYAGYWLDRPLHAPWRTWHKPAVASTEPSVKSAAEATPTKVSEPPKIKQPPLPPIAELAKLPGEAARGRELFFGTASCSKCHCVGGQGANVGPDLTEIQRKFDRSRLLDAIVNPSAAILLGYEGWAIATIDGRILTGKLVGQGDPLIVADIEGKQHAIPLDQIEERRLLSTSIMPEVSALGLGSQGLADLAEFLLALPLRETSR
jgi:putative membrane-bound dehydrogenase-like protein